jgi:serine/threonine protein kinase
MNDFEVGKKIPLKIGEDAIVKKKLGEGGQGAVYLVEYTGKPYALKWYTKSMSDKFRKNLENNISKGKPHDVFLWPEMITKEINGSFGYLMALRKPEYKDFSDFLLATAKFSSFAAMLNAAMQITEGFEQLHRQGFNYQDLNDGNFFINPQTGDVLICDNDNVSEAGQDSGILGKARYMAPEVVTGKQKPDQWTDRFSLSIALFLLFYCNHPLEGQRTSGIPCMTEELEKKLYGEDPVFIYDEKDASNRPVRGVHTNVIKRWGALPEILRTTFTKAFSKEAMTVVSERQHARVRETEWKKVFIAIRNTLGVCPHCKKETFINLDKAETPCMQCGKNIAKPNILKSGTEQVALMNGKKLYASTTQADGKHNTVSGEVVFDATKNMLGIKNLSTNVWIGFTRTGAQKNVEPNQVIPVLSGIKITFQGGKQAEII